MSEDSKKNWSSIVESVKTPIGLAALSFLVISAIGSAIAINGNDNYQLLMFSVFAMLFMGLILVFLIRNESQSKKLESSLDVIKLDQTIHSALDGFLDRSDYPAWANLLYCISIPANGDKNERDLYT